MREMFWCLWFTNGCFEMILKLMTELIHIILLSYKVYFVDCHRFRFSKRPSLSFIVLQSILWLETYENCQFMSKTLLSKVPILSAIFRSVSIWMKMLQFFVWNNQLSIFKLSQNFSGKFFFCWTMPFLTKVITRTITAKIWEWT